MSKSFSAHIFVKSGSINLRQTKTKMINSPSTHIVDVEYILPADMNFSDICHSVHLAVHLLV